ncbi:type VII secretion-associated serine protease mycosin [Rhodococcus sp. HNM0569]|nr:type VII secretion-associated serine protease mycosin [Rhodococcus sp. HNM0569]
MRAAGRTIVASGLSALTIGLASAPAGAVEPAPVVPGQMPPRSDVGEHRVLCTEDGGSPDSGTRPWAQRTMDFESVWPFARGGGQTVAVIDTGVSPNPRLPQLADAGDLVAGQSGLDDCDGHGTAVAGLIAAQPRYENGFTGGAPDARIVSIRQSSSHFAPKARGGQQDDVAQVVPNGFGDLNTMAEAIRKAADVATVINISEVACKTAAEGIGPQDSYVGSALQYAVEVKNVVVVAAAGNTGNGNPCQNQNPGVDPTTPGGKSWSSVNQIASPAWYDDLVLTVGSVDENGAPSAFSLGGPWVDVAAPGSNMTSLAPRGDGLTSIGGGTSYSAPLVAATVALVRQQHPELNARQVMDRVKATAHAPAEGWNPYVGYGVVDPLAAVTAELPTDKARVDAPRSVQIAALPPEVPPDTRPRTVALVGAGALAAVFAIGVLASYPLRRILRSRADR